MTIIPPFQGFPKEGTAFLQDLKNNNNREWFQENKSTYKEMLETPAKAFQEAMTVELGELIGQPLRGKIYRIYRDVRFSKDKTPYNTHVRMSFMPESKKDSAANPAFHFSLEPDKLIIGLGCFEFQKDVLASYRQMVANDKTGSALAMIVAEMEQQSIRIDGPQYKRVPSGFDPDHPRSDLLRRKGLSAWHDAPLPEAIHGPDAVRLCVEQYRTMLPVYDWLCQVA